MLDAITYEVSCLTDRVKAYRFVRLIETGELKMALEIKGLKGKALKAGGMFDRLNRAYDKLIEAGDAHAADVESLPSQIEGMHDDLTFMVQTLGNSVNGSGESEKPKEKPAEKQVIVPADVGKVADVLPAVDQHLVTVLSAIPHQG